MQVGLHTKHDNKTQLELYTLYNIDHETLVTQNTKEEDVVVLWLAGVGVNRLLSRDFISSRRE